MERHLICNTSILLLISHMMSSPKTAIVTGSAEGIGRAIALRLADDGCNLVLNDLPSHSAKLDVVADEIRAKSLNAVIYIGDVSVEEDVQNLVTKAVASFGGLDIMIANAGTSIIKSIQDCGLLVSTTSFAHLMKENLIQNFIVSLDDLDRVLAVNVRGVFLSYKYAAAQMIKQGRGGRIIGASSTAGKVGMPYLGAYAASKFAVRGLTQSAAQEWGPHGITVNTYCPGLVATPLTIRLNDEMSNMKLFGSNLDAREAWSKISAMKRHGEVEDIANLVSFLASEKSDFITGQSITADGGTEFS